VSEPFINKIARAEGDGINAFGFVRANSILSDRLAIMNSRIDAADCEFDSYRIGIISIEGIFRVNASM
jgi:hypothetical protein